MKTIDDVNITLDDVAEDMPVEKQTWKDVAKEKIACAYENVKEFVSDNAEAITIGVYVAFMGVICGQAIRGMHIANKTAQLEYNMKVLKSVKEL